NSNSLSLVVAKNKRTAMGKGRWTSQEHADFMIGLEKYGKDWKAIADVVRTRTTVQTRTHHQKYDKQVKKGRKFPEEPYEDDEDDGGGNGRKPRRTKAIRPSRAGILISPTPVAVRGKRLLTPPAGGGNGNGGGGSRGRPRSTRAASAAAAKAKAEADAAKALAEASAARAVEAEARSADAAAAAAAAEAAATGRVREEDVGEGSSDAGQTARGEYRPEKRVKTDHLSANCDAAAGTSSACGRQRFSFPSSVTAPGTATPPTVAEVPPSPRKDAAFTKSLWSSLGNLAAQGQPASGEVGMEGAVGGYVSDRELSGGASAMPVKAVTGASAGGGSGFTSCQLSPFLCETFLDGFVVGGEDAEALPPAAVAAPAFSMAASSSPPIFPGGHNVKTERSGRAKQEGDDGLLLARPGSSFSSAATATAAGYNAQQLLQQQQQQQQQQRLQQAQRQHQHQHQQQQRVLLSSGSAAVAGFGGLPDSTATLYPGTPFDPTATGIPIPGIGGLESFSPSGYACGFGSMSEGNGVGGGGILNPFAAASTSPVFYRRSDFGGGGGVLDDKLEFPGGVGMAGVVGEAGVGSLKHNEQAFGLDKRLAAFRQQQQQRMLGQVFHFRPSSAPSAATTTSMLSSSSSSFGDADAAHKLRRAAAAISPGAFDMNFDGDGGSTSSTSKGHKQDDVATSSVFGMSSDSGSSSSGGDTLSSDGLTDELAGYGSEGWPDDGMENLEQFDVLAVFAFDDHFGIL
ncbi:unnamed protein product, partial [Ectocarpus sp. 12 AP-2014]